MFTVLSVNRHQLYFLDFYPVHRFHLTSGEIIICSYPIIIFAFVIHVRRKQVLSFQDPLVNAYTQCGDFLSATQVLDVFKLTVRPTSSQVLEQIYPGFVLYTVTTMANFAAWDSLD
jgi:hypothetical protein